MTKQEILRQIEVEVATDVLRTHMWVRRGKYYKAIEPIGDTIPPEDGAETLLGWDRRLPNYTTDPVSADKVEQWILSYGGKNAKRELTYKYEYDSQKWRCWIRIWKLCGDGKYNVIGAPRCETHPGAETRLIALCLAILPEDRREYYQRLLKEAE